KHLKPLFVCRYPYSGDLLHWLRNIPNTYLHFGDIDFAGINIFLNEYYVHLGERSSFFTPPGLPELLAKYGNRNLYNKQSLLTLQPSHKAYAHLQPIVDLLHLHKKGLEQEIFIGLQKNANDD
ncbi:MAG: hypothetical protein LH478_12655, partial [Chitinophagaceae bacterium]|nr:hypothetical protein [Chitinophagaceae bacterium]